MKSSLRNFFRFLYGEGHTRDYAYRGEFRDEFAKANSGRNWIGRYLREYFWQFRWMLLGIVLVMGLNNSGPFVIAALNRVVVDQILVVTDEQGESMIPAKDVTGHPVRQVSQDHRVPGRTPPTEGLGRRMARGVRLNGRPVEAGKALLLLAILYIATQVFFNCVARKGALLMVRFSTQVLGRLREDMHRKVLELSLSYQQRATPGKLLSRIISDTSGVRDESATCLELLVNVSCKVTFGVGILLVSEWRVLVLLLAMLPFIRMTKRYFEPRMRALQRQQRHTNSALYGLISQKMDAIKCVQSYGQQQEEALAFRRLSSCFARDAVMVHWRYMLMNFLSWLSLHIENCLIFLVGGYLVATGRMSLGKLVFLQTLAQIFYQPVAEYAQLSFAMQRLQVVLARCFAVLDEVPEITEPPDAVPFPSPLKKGIEIQHVCYAYNTQKTEGEGDSTASASAVSQEVLSDVNLTVNAGEWLCIMGASGSGKTTLLHLLARLYLPTKGQILYDETPLDKVQILSLRRRLGVVPQEAQIFSGSVRDNIAYGLPTATNQQILDAAKAAQLHDFILEMPVQYETLIGEKGQSLSGGQRQRLSLARALLCQPEVLLLDDCTSALDANTERKIQETLITLLAGKTAVIVSQRVSMAVRCQHIAVLDHGTVSEYGTHQELLKNNGFYATLFREQTR